MTTIARAVPMPEVPPRFQMSLAVLMLAIAVGAAVSLNLRILVDHRDDLVLIWETILR